MTESGVEPLAVEKIDLGSRDDTAYLVDESRETRGKRCESPEIYTIECCIHPIKETPMHEEKHICTFDI